MITTKEKTKRYVRYQEGADLYSMSLRKFTDIARDAGAVRKIGGMALVSVDCVDRYIESFAPRHI